MWPEPPIDGTTIAAATLLAAAAFFASAPFWLDWAIG
jgi:hypothetical protein